jgi:hypothetical protein
MVPYWLQMILEKQVSWNYETCFAEILMNEISYLKNKKRMYNVTIVTGDSIFY